MIFTVMFPVPLVLVMLSQGCFNMPEINTNTWSTRVVSVSAAAVLRQAHDSKTLSQAADYTNAESKAHVTHSSGFLDDQPDQKTAKASVSHSQLLKCGRCLTAQTYRSAMNLTQQDQKLDIVLRNQGVTDSAFQVSAKQIILNSLILRKTKTLLSIAVCFSSSHVFLWKALELFHGACFVSFCH